MLNLAGRTLLYGPLNLKAVFVAEYLMIYRQVFLIFIASKSLKLSFNFKLSIKTYLRLNNDFILTRFAFDPLQKFEVVPREKRSSRTHQAHSREIINILLTSFSRSLLEVTDPGFFLVDLQPARFALGP